MTLLFIDGFDHYTGDLDKWDTAQPNDVSINGSTGRDGSGGSLVTVDNDAYYSKVLDVPTQTLIMGAAVKCDVKQSIGSNVIFSLYNDAARQISLGWRQNGQLLIKRGSTIIDDTTKAFKVGKWYYIEWKVTVDNSTGSYEVRVNNETVMSATNVDTQDGASALIDEYMFGCRVGNDAFAGKADDFYVANTSGTVNNDFLGDSRIITLFPSGNGTTSDFVGSDGNSTDNYQLVDENPISTADYVESSGVGDVDLYTTDDMSITPLEIFGFQVASNTDKTDTGARTYSNLTRVSGVNYSGVAYSPSFGDYDVFTELWEENPNTAAAWQKSEIDNLEIGIKVES